MKFFIDFTDEKKGEYGIKISYKKGKMRKAKTILIIIIFLFANLFGLMNYSNATFNNGSVRRVSFKISIDKLVNDQFYVNNNIQKSRLMVPRTEEINSDYSNNFYFNQISNQMAKDIYNGLLQNVNTTGQINISTNVTIQLTSTEDDKLTEVYNGQVKPNIYDALCAFILDNPEYYWIQYAGIDGDVIADVNDETLEMKITQVQLQVSEVSEINNKDQFNTKLNEVANSVSGDNIYDVAKGIHDYICTNVQSQDVGETDIGRTAYGALMNNIANSEGQSNLFVLLCRAKGINAVVIRGKALNKDEQWAAVYQSDEQRWFGVDVYLDNGSTDTYNYFMVGNNTEIDGQKFSITHIANVIGYEDQATTFKAPALTNTAYGEFGVSVQYSNTEPTNNNVIVTITANREIRAPEGWTLSGDKKSIQKTYTQNTTETVVITSENDETIEQEIIVQNIDKTAPNVTVNYSQPDPSTGSVTVTLTSDEELQQLEGWTLSTDRKTLTKTYTENTTETVVVYDLASNTTEVNIEVNTIGEGTFKCQISYSETNPTKDNVVAIISSDRELKAPEGWTLTTDPKQVMKTYTDNAQETVTVEDTEGNTTTVNVNIQNIDRTAPTLQVSYSTTELTNQSVVVTITSNEQLQQPEGWIITSDKLTISKTYTLNTNETVSVSDLAGNTVNQNIAVTNIDKEPPQVHLDYQNNNNQVIVTITSNEQLQQLEGWILAQDGLSLTKIYTENTVDVVDVMDLAGNIREVTVEVNTLPDNNVNNNNNQTTITPNGNNQNSDQTVSPTMLPQTGVISIITIVSILIVLSIVLYIKYRKYDEYTRDTKRRKK